MLTDWSAQGLLCFWADALYVLPIDGDRKAVRLVKGNPSPRAGRFSPDGRFIAYTDYLTARNEVYVAALSGSALAGKPLQVSKGGALGGTVWRKDSRELYFLTLVGFVAGPEMVVDVSTSPELEVSEPRPLFRPGLINAPGQLSSVATPDGERFTFLTPAR